MDKLLNERIAETAHSALWGLARSANNYENPPWDILPRAIKQQYKQAVCLVWEFPEATATQFYKFVSPVDQQAPIPSAEQNLNFNIFRGVVEAFRKSTK